MEIFNICLSLVTVLLGLAYPIIIQLTSDNKFSSDAILDLFEEHIYHKGFKISLIVTLCLVLLNLLITQYILNNWNCCCLFYSILNGLLDLLLLTSSVVLVILFFQFVGLVKIFYTAEPDFPDKISKKQFWLQNIEYFKKQVDEISKNQLLIKTLGYKESSDYDSFFSNLINKLKGDLDSTIRLATPEIEKTKLFLETSKVITDRTFLEFEAIHNENLSFEEEDTNINSISGEGRIMDKKVYLEDSVSHINFHSFLGHLISEKYSEQIAISFLVNTTENYIYNEEDIFKAIDNLEITNNHSLISFGITDWSYFTKTLAIEGMNERGYRESRMLRFPFYSNVLAP